MEVDRQTSEEDTANVLVGYAGKLNYSNHRWLG